MALRRHPRDDGFKLDGREYKYDLDHFGRRKMLGRGGTSNVHVYAAIDQERGNKVAVKEIHIDHSTDRSKELKGQVDKEISVLRKLDHPNIIKYIGEDLYYGDEASSRYRIVTEGGSEGTMHDCVVNLEKDGECIGVPLNIAIYDIKQLLEAVKYMHEKDIIHCDIKSSNIVIYQNGVAKLINFGACREVKNESTTQTREGTSPLLAFGDSERKASKKSVDIYAIGAVFIELLIGRCPTRKEVKQFAENNSFDFTKDVYSLIKSCLHKDHCKRPNAKALLEHHLFTDRDAIEISSSDSTLSCPSISPNQSTISANPKRSSSDSALACPSIPPNLATISANPGRISSDSTLSCPSISPTQSTISFNLERPISNDCVPRTENHDNGQFVHMLDSHNGWHLDDFENLNRDDIHQDFAVNTLVSRSLRTDMYAGDQINYSAQQEHEDLQRLSRASEQNDINTLSELSVTLHDPILRHHALSCISNAVAQCLEGAVPMCCNLLKSEETIRSSIPMVDMLFHQDGTCYKRLEVHLLITTTLYIFYLLGALSPHEVKQIIFRKASINQFYTECVVMMHGKCEVLSWFTERIGKKIIGQFEAIGSRRKSIFHRHTLTESDSLKSRKRLLTSINSSLQNGASGCEDSDKLADSIAKEVSSFDGWLEQYICLLYLTYQRSQYSRVIPIINLILQKFIEKKNFSVDHLDIILFTDIYTRLLKHSYDADVYDKCGDDFKSILLRAKAAKHNRINARLVVPMCTPLLFHRCKNVKDLIMAHIFDVSEDDYGVQKLADHSKEQLMDIWRRNIFELFGRIKLWTDKSVPCEECDAGFDSECPNLTKKKKVPTATLH